MLMHAADERCGFICMARDTLYRLGMVGVWVSCDGRMTGLAIETAMHTGVKGISIHSDVVASGILHGDITMAGEAVGLRVDGGGERREKEHRASCDEGLPANDSLRGRRVSTALPCRK
jgi:hypothetical protein